MGSTARRGAMHEETRTAQEYWDYIQSLANCLPSTATEDEKEEMQEWARDCYEARYDTPISELETRE